MNRKDYFGVLDETSSAVSPIIRGHIEPFLEIDKELYDILMFFIDTRVGKRLLKPALLRLSFEVCGGKDWRKVIPAAVAFEFINISSYQANSSFDGKLGISTRSQKNSQFIASMITRELAQKAASELKDIFGEGLTNSVYECLSKSNYHIYLAQHWDLNVLSVSRYENYLDEQKYLAEYVKRCYYGSGVFSGQCAYVGALLAGARSQEAEALREFGENYGTALHMVNDIGDYVPPGTYGRLQRDFADQYSDFKNGRLTLPLYHSLRFGVPATREKLEAVLNGKHFDSKSLLEVSRLLLKEGSIDYARRTAKEYFKRSIRCLRIFENSESKSGLLILAAIIKSNKHLYAFNKLNREYSSDAFCVEFSRPR